MKVLVLDMAVVVMVARLSAAYPMMVLTRLPREALLMVPQELESVPIMVNTGSFKGEQEGEAKTKVTSLSDSASGLTQTGLEAALENGGMLSGAVNAMNKEGNASSGQYAGRLLGTGGLWADTKSVASDEGAAAQTRVQGFMSGEGTISGGVGAGSAGERYEKVLLD